MLDFDGSFRWDFYCFFIALLMNITMVGAQPDGSLDADFDADGVAIYEPPGLKNGSAAQAIVLQSDGRIILGGRGTVVSLGVPYDYLTLLRVQPDGSLDPSFGQELEGGWVIESDFGLSHLAVAVILLPDGRILAAGTHRNNKNFTFQYFDKSGKLQTNVGTESGLQVPFGEYARLRAVAQQADGKIVAVGETSDGLSNRFAIARIIPSMGIVDNTFSFDGKVVADFGGLSAVAKTVAVQPDGKILVGGVAGNRFAMVRYSAEGSLDQSFGTGGKVLTNRGQEVSLEDMVLQPDGKILVVGTASSGAYPAYTLIRYLPDGSLDLNFGEDGAAVVPSGILVSVALQSDGKIVAAGSTFPGSGLQVLRFLANGTLDPSFGNGGLGTVVSNASATDLQIQNDGKILVSGQKYISTQGAASVMACLVRYHAKAVISSARAKENSTDYSIYPNPVGDVLTCRLGTSASTDVELTLLDAMGRVQLRATPAYPVAEYQMSVAHLPVGTYHLVVRVGSHQKTSLIIKL